MSRGIVWGQLNIFIRCYVGAIRANLILRPWPRFFSITNMNMVLSFLLLQLRTEWLLLGM